ncbi:MAG: hypothetical protein M0Q21_06060 [Ignavibacteriaceae bacterium]|nr:hypothetical protein [Ignavibacteriaceae bacterium]
MKKLLFFLFPIMLFFSCTDVKTTETVQSLDGTLTFNLINLPALDDSLVLAAWILDDAGKVVHKFGKLSISGNSFTGSFPLTLNAYQQNTKNQFVCISIERRDSTLNDTTTSNLFLMLSKIRTNSSELNVVPKNPVGITFGSDFDDQKYLGTDTSSAVPPSFKTAKGSYTVFTPTGANANSNSGIWFLNYVSAGVYGTGLRLPELPTGWTYKGWVKVNGKYLPTGEFKLAAGNDAQNLYVGTNPMPTFPGEDFLQNDTLGVAYPIDLAGQEVMISVEPNGFNGYNKSKPFPLLLLKAVIPTSVSNTTSLSLQNNYSSFPTGTAVYKINIY